MIIDSHVHVWPDVIAERALSAPQGDLERFGNGTVGGALAAMDEAGIDLAVTLNVANVPQHAKRVNEFAGGMDPARFIGFGTIHPDLSVEENLENLESNNLKGVKIHPLFQGFSLEDRRLWNILDALRGRYIAVIHVGEGGDPAGNERCTPLMLRNLIHALPGMDIVACHFGGYRRLDEADELIIGQQVYVDTSWPPGLTNLEAGRVREVIRRHGAERVIFASDWPMGEPHRDLAAIRDLGLDDDEVERIVGMNMAELLGVG